MFRPATRSFLRSAQSSLAPGRTLPARRFLSTAPPHQQSRSWKSSAARWSIAIAGIYFYNTSSLFAEEPSNNLLNPNLQAVEQSPLDLDALASPKKSPKPSAAEQTLSQTSKENASTTTTSSGTPESSNLSVSATDPSATPSELEEEASAEGAFNPVTGEINWDCPCLGGMAHGPCGEEFRAAFSCFVFSEAEPKGMECIDKFKGMQDCFREHPDVYKGELEDDEMEEELDEGLAAERASLEKEVQERRAAVEEKKQSKSSRGEGKRLLDDSNPPSQKVPLRKPKQTPSSNTKPSSSSSPTADQKETKISEPSSSEPHPGMSEDHDMATAASTVPSSPKQDSPTTATDKSQPESKGAFDEDLELMPKAWHDAREGGKPNIETAK